MAPLPGERDDSVGMGEKAYFVAAVEDRDVAVGDGGREVRRRGEAAVWTGRSFWEWCPDLDCLPDDLIWGCGVDGGTTDELIATGWMAICCSM